MKRVLSLVLSLVLILGVLPLTVSAASEVFDVDFATELELATVEDYTMSDSDMYIEVDISSDEAWSGYAVGRHVYLEADVPYMFAAYAYNSSAVYVDRAIALYPDNIQSEEQILAVETAQSDNEECEVVLRYTPDESGYYNLLVWGYAEDDEGVELPDTQIGLLFDVDKLNGYIDFDTELEENVVSEFEVTEDTPYVDISDIGWDGCANGFTVYLQQGEIYTFEVTVSNEDATYVDRAIALFPEDALFDWEYYDYTTEWAETSEVTVCYTVEINDSGYYKLLVWGVCLDEEYNELFDGTTGSVLFYNGNSANVDYSTELEFDTETKIPTAETDPFIAHNDWWGYANGFNADLEKGKAYKISVIADVKSEEIDYIDRAIAVFGDDMKNQVAMSSDSFEDVATVDLTFVAPETRNYKLLFWGYCEDDNEEPLFGDEYATFTVYLEEIDVDEVIITTAEELIAFGNDLSDYKFGETIRAEIKADIDMTGKEWNPASADNNELLIVNGNGHTISGLSDMFISEADTVYFNDLTIESEISYVASDDVYEIYGLAAFVGDSSEARFSNCELYGSISAKDFDVIDNVGGFFGYATYATIDNCYVECDITLDSVYETYDIGGIGGYVDYTVYVYDTEWNGTIEITNIGYEADDVGAFGCIYNDSVFENVAVNASINIDGDTNCDYVGGLVGYLEDYNVFNNCYVIADIDTGYAYYVGGLCGYIDEANEFYNCYTEGSVSGSYNIGGFVGASDCCGYNLFANNYTTMDVAGIGDVGGFIGEAYYEDSFVNCYATGVVYANDEEADEDYIGGFVGYFDSDDFNATNCVANANCEYSPVGAFYGYDIEGLTALDFNDDDAVDEYESLLNAFVDEVNKNGELAYELSYWGGRNEDNGPVFTELFYVVFHVDDSPIDEQVIFSGDTAEKPEDPVQENKIFLGWYTEDGELYDFDTPVTSDVNLFAKFKDVVLGDIDNDGDVDASDYVLVKRAVLKTYNLTEEQFDVADIDGDNDVDATDYVLVKRIVLGTYEVK